MTQEGPSAVTPAAWADSGGRRTLALHSTPALAHRARRSDTLLELRRAYMSDGY
jgi:hypothetical protein